MNRADPDCNGAAEMVHFSLGSELPTIHPQTPFPPHRVKILGMIRPLVTLSCCAAGSLLWASDRQSQRHPSFDYDVARTHEVQPHRRTVPLDGVREGFNQLRLTVTVSSEGEVIDAEAGGDPDELKFWPQLQTEVHAWRFVPFKRHGRPVVAQVEEYIDLVPPERLPSVQRPAPILRPDSKITIVLTRSACYGTCPSYDVTVSNGGIEFNGHSCVGEFGKHTAPVEESSLRQLATKFVAADFYSMDNAYEATVTDEPFYGLSISIDGQKKNVTDYMGRWVGMPGVIRELENDVDALAQTRRWVQVKGGKASIRRACVWSSIDSLVSAGE